MLSMRGQDMPTDNMVEVASFHTDLPAAAALEQAFRLTNHGDRQWQENPGINARLGVGTASTSIGDVVVVDAEAFQCVAGGWRKLDGFGR